MKRFALLLAFYAGAFGPSFAVMSQPPVSPPHDVQAAFDFACDVLDYDCSKLAPPAVVWEPLFLSMGAFGMYDGDATVHMDNSVLRFGDEVMIQSVLAHEIVHYLDVTLGVVVFPFTHESVCVSEFNAWRVGNAYVLTHGRPDFADFSWAERYGCFQ
jgi:hypothetical protein